MWYLYSQGTEYASKDWSTCSILDELHWRKTVRCLCRILWEEIDTCSRRRTVLVDTVAHIQSQIRKHTPWPSCWWTSISTSMDSQISCTWITVENLWITYGENCSLNSRYSTLQHCNIIRNPVERFHRTLIVMLRTRGEGVQDNWDLWINASVFAYNTTVSSKPLNE